MLVALEADIQEAIFHAILAEQKAARQGQPPQPSAQGVCPLPECRLEGTHVAGQAVHAHQHVAMREAGAGLLDQAVNQRLIAWR